MTLAVNLANLVDGLGADGTITDAKSISDKPNTSTGYFDLPSGTTGQRPGSPTTGMVRHNSSLGLIETWNGTAWTGLLVGVLQTATSPVGKTAGVLSYTADTRTLSAITPNYTSDTSSWGSGNYYTGTVPTISITDITTTTATQSSIT